MTEDLLEGGSGSMHDESHLHIFIRRSNFRTILVLKCFWPIFRDPRVFGHYYTNTTPILSVQRPLLFHSVSLEYICNVGL
jgi:hypothetical protein